MCVYGRRGRCKRKEEKRKRDPYPSSVPPTDPTTQPSIPSSRLYFPVAAAATHSQPFPPTHSSPNNFRSSIRPPIHPSVRPSIPTHQAPTPTLETMTHYTHVWIHGKKKDSEGRRKDKEQGRSSLPRLLPPQAHFQDPGCRKDEKESTDRYSDRWIVGFVVCCSVRAGRKTAKHKNRKKRVGSL